MVITLDHCNEVFGLTVKNSTIPAMQEFLQACDITVTYPDAEHAVLDVASAAIYSPSFRLKVRQIERAYENRQLFTRNFINKFSWSTLNNFMGVLGVGVITTTIYLLAGASILIPATIGLAALIAYGLFRCYQKNESDITMENQISLSDS